MRASSPKRKLQNSSAILEALKPEGGARIASLAAGLCMLTEAVRQQIRQLEREGWVESIRGRRSPHRSGRPAATYRLTPAGDHLFPKRYGVLASALIDAISQELGPEALRKILATLTQARVREWEPRLAGLSLPERVQALKGVYLTEDAFMEAKRAPGGCSRACSACRCGARSASRTRTGRCVFRIFARERLGPKALGFRFEKAPGRA